MKRSGRLFLALMITIMTIGLFTILTLPATMKSKHMAAPISVRPDPVAQPPSHVPLGPSTTRSKVDDLLDAMPIADTTFVSPLSGVVGTSFEAFYAVNIDNIAVPAGSVARNYEAKISPIMEAVLVGYGFSIEPVTPTKQAVSFKQGTMWRWQVTPTMPGPRTLDLSLSATVDVEGKDVPLVVRTLQKDILVNVAPKPVVPWYSHVLAFLSNNWQWLSSTLIIPLFIWWWSHGRKHRRRHG